jgi:hypothetical protein
MQETCSYKWALQVLRQRGIPAPEESSARAAVESADEASSRRLFAALKAIEQGVEQPEELQWVRDQLGDPIPSQQNGNRGGRLLVQYTQAVESEGQVRGERLTPRTINIKGVHPDQTHRDFGRKHHIYGKRGALTVELDTLRKTGFDKQQFYTVAVEAAYAKGTRAYNWEHKIPFQVMKKELPLIVCALMGLLDSPLTLANHGKESNKALRIEDQGAHLFVQVSMGSRVIAVQVGPSDVHAWAEMALEAIKRNAPEITDAMQLAILRRIAGMHNKGNADDKV